MLPNHLRAKLVSVHATIRIPLLLDRSRRTAFWSLVGFATCEVFAQVAATGVLKALLVDATGGSTAIMLLVLTGLMAAGFSFARDVAGEHIGLDYANDVRRTLARQAIAVAGHGGAGRFGTIALRMTGDLSALKDWARIGVCGGIAGTLGLIGAIMAAWMTAGWAGLIATMIGPFIAAFALAALISRLYADVRERRRHKGRLSARIGDLLLGASASAAFASERRAISTMDRAASDALAAQTRQVGTETLMRLPALLALPFGAATAVALEGLGLAPRGGMAGWATLLFALSLASLACAQISNAVAQFVERRIAMAKLVDLATMATNVPSAAPKGTQRLKAGPGIVLAIDDTDLVLPGKQTTYTRADASEWLEDVLSGAKGVSANGIPASDVRDIDWARRVAYAGPARGLVRGRLDLVLAARRRASGAAMRTALGLVGLPASLVQDNPVIDPQSTSVDQDMRARLRLARALAHGPRVLILDDPWLFQDDALTMRVRAWCTASKVSLIEIGSNARSEPGRRAA